MSQILLMPSATPTATTKKALRKAKIHVVALHNHMVGERPAYYFTHFWAKGPAEELARGFKAVLDAQASAGKANQH